MKIGIVYYNSGKKGGAERRYYNLISALSKLTRVYILSNSSVLDLWRDLGGFSDSVILECIFIDNTIISSQTKIIDDSPKFKFSIRNIFKKMIPKKIRSSIKTYSHVLNLNIDVFIWSVKHKITHINTLQASGILAVLAKFSGRKIVFSYVDYMVENGYPFYWISNLGLKTVVRISDRYDFLSEMIPKKMSLMGLKLPQQKIFIPSASFTDFSKFTISFPKKKKIVFAGRMETIKNPFLALYVVNELKKRKISFSLTMLGDGSLRTDLEEFIKINQLDDSVRIYSTTKVEEELSDALIFLSLQQENNYPSQALLEAMASGCIPIATDVGETRKIVDEKVGFLVSDDVVEIANVICQIFDNIDFFEKKGSEIRAVTMSKFGVDQYLNYYYSLFQFSR